MRRLCLWPLFCAAALFAGAQHEITGRVVDAQTGAPVGHARVTITLLRPGTDSAQVVLLSDEAGVFDLKNAPEGSYQVTCERPGYLAANRPGQNVPASVSPDKPFTIQLIPQVAIEGSVVDEKGAPVLFAAVHVYVEAVMEGRRRPQEVSNAESDDTGRFRVFALSAGRYRIGVTAAADPSSRPKVVYPQVFYPNSLDLNGGEPMDLSPGQERHLEIRLPRPVPSRKISGQVNPASESVSLQIRRADDPLPIQFSISYQWDQKSGSFSVTNIPAGEYVLEAFVGIDNQQRRASISIAVGSRDITGIRLEPRAPATLRGVVRLEGKNKPGGQSPAIMLRPTHSQGQYAAQVDPDGNFKFDNLPEGQYRLSISSGGPAYLSSALRGGRDVLRDGVMVYADSAPEPLEIVLKGPGATIEGAYTVQDSAGKNVSIALLRLEGSEMVAERVWNLTVPADPAGTRFTMEGVAPGDYILYAWPADTPVPYADPDFQERYGTIGKTISVSGDEKIRVTVDRLLTRIDP